jgi:hypothetical protein
MLDPFRHWMNKEGVQDIQLRQANALDLENQLPQSWTGYDLMVSAAMLEYIPQSRLESITTAGAWCSIVALIHFRTCPQNWFAK